MRDDLAYPHIGIAIHFIMIKHTRHERFGAILGPLPVACARRVRPRTTSTPTPPPAPGRGSCSPNRMFVHAHAKNRWSPMKGLLNTLSGGFIFSIGQSHTKLSRVWPPCPSSHVALRKARLSLLS